MQRFELATNCKNKKGAKKPLEFRSKLTRTSQAALDLAHRHPLVAQSH